MAEELSAMELIDGVKGLLEDITTYPWIAQGFDVFETSSEHGDVVAECGLAPLDARFIAAAPEIIERMYWALKGTLQHVEDCKTTGHKVDGEYIEWYIRRALENEV